MKDTILMQIANCLSANEQKITDIGLLEGKMGVAVYLYWYARYSGHSEYKNLANNLIDEVITGISEKDISISKGLSGIGWGINHLLKEKFLQGEDDLLEDFDECILQYIKENTNENMLDGCIYLICEHSKPLDESMIKIFTKQFSLFLLSGNYPLSTLNKLLHIANRIPSRHLFPLYDTLLNVALHAIHTKAYRCSDLMICKDLLEAFPENDDNQIRKELCDLCTSLLFRSISYLDRLEAIWQNLVFSGGTVNMQHDINRISMLVTDKLKDLLASDLYLSCGLPAIGMDILLTDEPSISLE